MSDLLVCQGIECRLGHVDVLRGVSLRLEVGQSTALVGASGSGKSTLLRIIAGLEIPSRGVIILDEHIASRDGKILMAPHRRDVAMLFQDVALWPNLTVDDNIRLGLSGQRLGRDETKSRTSESLVRCGLTGLGLRLPRTLSGGQQQRAALARALARRPKLLLLDEPYAGLDLLTKQSVTQEIVRLRYESGFSLLLVTHDPWEINALCDSLAVLEDGRIAEFGALSEVAANPRTALARAICHGEQTPSSLPPGVSRRGFQGKAGGP